LIPGAVHVGLDVTPVIGTAKGVVEIFTGDLILIRRIASKSYPHSLIPAKEHHPPITPISCEKRLSLSFRKSA
jgi:hypothetical protein